MAFRAEGIPESPVWCFASYAGWQTPGTLVTVGKGTYAGTGPNGSILFSDSLSSWSLFMSVGDCHARSLAVWGNALFVGTQPKGRIYVHNFSSRQEYLFVETEDSAVTAFAEYGGKLYAGTAPAGIVYSFDGVVWREEHRPYGSGVAAMVASDQGLFVFSRGAEGPVVFDGSSWKTYPGQQNGVAGTASSNRTASGGIHGSSGQEPIDPAKVVSPSIPRTSGLDVHEVHPASPQFNVAAAAATASGPAFGGLDNGVVLVAGGGGFSKLLDVGAPVSAIAGVGDAVMVASGGTVFLARAS